jgi:hypothetical protein
MIFLNEMRWVEVFTSSSLVIDLILIIDQITICRRNKFIGILTPNKSIIGQNFHPVHRCICA